MGLAVLLVKVIVVVFNIILASIGVALIIVGTQFEDTTGKAVETIEYYGHNENIDVLKLTFTSVGIITISIGSILLVTAIVGIFGAILRNSCALVCYSIVLLVLTFIVAVIGSITLWAAGVVGKYEEDIEKVLVPSTFKDYRWNSTDDIPDEIDSIQRFWKCCGNHNYSEWDEVRPAYIAKSNYPYSCCSKSNDSADCTAESSDFQELSCSNQINVDASKYIRNFAFSAFGMAAKLLFIVILSYVLMCTKSGKDENKNRGQLIALQARNNTDNDPSMKPLV